MDDGINVEADMTSWTVEMDRKIALMRRDPVRYVEVARRDAGKRPLPATSTKSSEATVSPGARKR